MNHTISAYDIRPHISRVEAVRAFPVPNDKESLHRFVGLINYLSTLSDAVMLVHHNQNAPTLITTDASNRAVGGVLEQFINGQWKPISFFSKKLCQAELLGYPPLSVFC